jgi:hypothetical protein
VLHYRLGLVITITSTVQNLQHCGHLEALISCSIGSIVSCSIGGISCSIGNIAYLVHICICSIGSVQYIVMIYLEHVILS